MDEWSKACLVLACSVFSRFDVVGLKHSQVVVEPNGLVLAGIEVQAFIERTEGDEDLLYMLLNEFASEFDSALAKIRAAIAARDVELAHRFAHKLRGAASSLSATQLEQAALALEENFKAGRLEGRRDR